MEFSKEGVYYKKNRINTCQRWEKNKEAERSCTVMHTQCHHWPMERSTQDLECPFRVDPSWAEMVSPLYSQIDSSLHKYHRKECGILGWGGSLNPPEATGSWRVSSHNFPWSWSHKISYNGRFGWCITISTTFLHIYSSYPHPERPPWYKLLWSNSFPAHLLGFSLPQY